MFSTKVDIVRRAIQAARRRAPQPSATLTGVGAVLCFLALVCWNAEARAQRASARGEVPVASLPRYDVALTLAADGRRVQARQRVTWTNRHRRPTNQAVLNVFSHYRIADAEIDFEAKMLEIERLRPSEVLDYEGHAFSLHQVQLVAASRPLAAAPVSLPARFRPGSTTILEVDLPFDVQIGEAVTFDLTFSLELPEKQGPWGRWKEVTSLTNWLPVLAYYDESGWQPVPFVRWHPAIFQEAGAYHVSATIPADYVVLASAAIASDQADGAVRHLEFVPQIARDFALVASPRFRRFSAERDGVQVQCVAFPEHEHYARVMLGEAADALDVYARWFGPYPYSQLGIAETFNCWQGATSAGMILMDERVFRLPHAGRGFVEHLVAQHVARQWWHNIVGSHGYSETWMDEGISTYFANRLLDRKLGKNNGLLRWPNYLQWLPQIERDAYQNFGVYGTMGRGEAGPTIQDIPKYQHSINLTSMVSDRGQKIVGIIESRLGERKFLEFMRVVQTKYGFRMLRVADLQRELEAFTGQSWHDFFQNWLYSAGTPDWKIDSVRIVRVVADDGIPRYQVRAHVEQVGDFDEPTCVGFQMGDDARDVIRIPLDPDRGDYVVADPPANVWRLAAHRWEIECQLAESPAQVAVDPDRILLDREPANNHWRPEVRVRLTPLYTPLDESELTCPYDRWTVLGGPWVSDSAYNDPWFAFTEIVGARVGAFRSHQFAGGVYTGYRTNFNDLAVGANALREHWPWPNTQFGFNVESSLTTLGTDGTNGHRGPDRGIGFARYVFDESDSLYLPPMHFVEAFGSIADNYFPQPRHAVPGAVRFPRQTLAGAHYHINYLTPYWDPEGGFEFDVTAADGLPYVGQPQASQLLTTQLAMVHEIPESLGWLSTTRIATRLYGATGLPTNALLFSLGGSQLFRGYDLQARQGSSIWIGSVEWRVPVKRNVDWDVLDSTASLRNSYLAFFYDTGDAYVRGRQVGGVAQAVGIGLRLDVAWFSFLEHSTLRFDLAKSVHDHAPVQFWFGTEHPF